MIKRIILIIHFVFIVLVLSGCKSDIYYYDSNDYRGEVIAIQVIEVINGGRGNILYKFDESLFGDFLNDLSKIRWSVPFGSPPSYFGISFCIYYNDLSYDIISRDCIKVDGHYCWCRDDDLFFKLLANYYYNRI